MNCIEVWKKLGDQSEDLSEIDITLLSGMSSIPGMGITAPHLIPLNHATSEVVKLQNSIQEILRRTQEAMNAHSLPDFPNACEVRYAPKQNTFNHAMTQQENEFIVGEVLNDLDQKEFYNQLYTGLQDHQHIIIQHDDKLDSYEVSRFEYPALALNTEEDQHHKFTILSGDKQLSLSTSKSLDLNNTLLSSKNRIELKAKALKLDNCYLASPHGLSIKPYEEGTSLFHEFIIVPYASSAYPYSLCLSGYIDFIGNKIIEPLTFIGAKEVIVKLSRPRK